MPIDDKVYFEHLYKEYEALNTRIDFYSSKAFEDFKLLGAIGVMFAWEPLWNKLNLHSPYILLLGFLLIALMISIIECQNLLKLSLIRYYMRCLGTVEEELLCLAERCNSPNFHVARKFKHWYKSPHKWIIIVYKLLLYITTIVFPTAVMSHLNTWSHLNTGKVYALPNVTVEWFYFLVSLLIVGVLCFLFCLLSKRSIENDEAEDGTD